ncbi:MAG: prepilin-type N-terminal cleavage/methylation domain-containing protein [Candidatus Zixiibacteriota bacterium]
MRSRFITSVSHRLAVGRLLRLVCPTAQRWGTDVTISREPTQRVGHPTHHLSGWSRLEAGSRLPRFTHCTGFTLVELVIVIVILGIIATVATRKMTSTIESSRYDATLREMEQLARAIRGNPETWAEGARADFGYVGNVGAFPSNLDALVTNPGMATWAGPYIELGSASDDFKKDGWGTAYTLIGTTLRSTGSGANIDKEVVSAVTWLTSNTITGSIVDANNNVPGSVYKDSLRVIVSYPDGSGGTATASVVPSSKGNFTIATLPIGNRQLLVVWIPDNDTMSWSIAIYPNKSAHLSVVFPSDLF